MSGALEQRLEVQLQGLVQGVGFRPTVHRLAQRHRLRGWVGNSELGAELVVEGPGPELKAFLAALPQQLPPRCRIDSLQQQWGPARGEPQGFRISAPSSSRAAGASALVSPDLATCGACLAELQDPTNRRHGYPLISCTDCGPRYSVLNQLPFERIHTSLAAFPLCGPCQADYEDPANRRFHAQTLGCSTCGPQLHWRGQANPIGQADKIEEGNQGCIAAAAAALRRGEIVAVQGMGGFQLLVDARNGPAIAELRRRKGRPAKPLALMAPRPWISAYCQLSAAEGVLLDGPVAPILLLRRKSNSGNTNHASATRAVALEVAGKSAWLGVMAPTTGLHHLLLEDFGGAVVATSANRSGEPLCRDANADGSLLAHLADGVLSHSLEIVNRLDDSVMRVSAGRPMVLRLGRGLAPLAIPLPGGPGPESANLALGAHQKGSFAVAIDGPSGKRLALLSPELGNLGTSAGEQHLSHTLGQWIERHGCTVGAIACDQHPGYVSSQVAEKLALSAGLPIHRVQHHHAHLLACLAEHGSPEDGSPEQDQAVGVAWDGAGLGPDGSIWGGECLAFNRGGFTHLAQLRPFHLPGGEQALREPRRAALGLLVAGFGATWRTHLAGLAASLPAGSSLLAFRPDELELLGQAIEQGINSPRCSSVGRLFDAMASLLGLHQHCSYEGQAAMALEALALEDLALEDGALEDMPLKGNRYRIPIRRQGLPQAPWLLDWGPLLDGVLADLTTGVPPSTIALGFHLALAEVVGQLAGDLGVGQLFLAGGCFQNQLLLEQAVRALEQRGVEALWPQQLPCNDAALPVGQLLRQIGRGGAGGQETPPKT
ncbi:MAG: carbamoyltransferase HypF [Cyanobium sp. LacPavin_0920_WC12_MAG_62_9]|nr:carbamoyltransferase HypF [Cyanobium sp. LacPavin_0920_WC12_MAG_62_9]